MKTEPLAMSQMVSSMVGREEQLFRSGGDLSIDKGRPYKGWGKIAVWPPSSLGLLAGLFIMIPYELIRLRIIFLQKFSVMCSFSFR